MSVNANEVFEGKELTLFLKLQKNIPDLFNQLKLTAELTCLVNSDKTPSHYYIDVKPNHKEEGIKLFASIELTEIAKKLFLIENIIQYSEKHNMGIEEALVELEKKDHVYLTVEQGIEALATIMSFNRQDKICQLETIQVENMTVH